LDGGQFPEASKCIDAARGFIFDLDGTLYETPGIAVRLILARPADMFLMRAERVIRRQFAGRDFGSPEAWEEAFFAELARYAPGRPFGFSRARRSPAALRAWYFERYLTRMAAVLERQYRARPGTAALLGSLAVPFAIYSDYPLPETRLKAIGLNPALPGMAAGAYRGCYSPADFGAHKPAVRPFLEIAKTLDCAPESVLVVGDRDDTDGAGARAAGMRYIRITTQKNRTHPEGPGPALDWENFIRICSSKHLRAPN
jgi:FMN phosphatase YigB (HAD superfamily)